jgi:DNA mismatch repair protein MutS
MRTGERRGSLLWVLDKTKTPMGHRLLSSQLIRPLMDVALIRRRLGAVDELVKKSLIRNELRLLLTNIPDFERLMSRVSSRTANPRDLVALAGGLEQLPKIHELLHSLQSPLLHELDTGLDELQDLARLIRHGIEPEPPLTLRDGGVIRPGFNEQLDKLRRIIEDSGSLIAETEKAERERTGLKLRIGYNRVFGYYIEVPNAQRDKVPAHYIRKQTLANAERFITEELKELESTILTAREKATRLEYELFERTLEQVAAELIRVQGAARVIAMADFLASLAEAAEKYDYCMPTVDVSDKIEITEGRHPVVERAGGDMLFVPNDTYLDCAGTRAAIITGPNMAGKSTYMRQVALIVIMAQMGSFVPAKSARIGLVDKIFTRVGASDDLSAGHSTFMLEMIEVADILKTATPRSLIILDEVGRGTSTFDGMAIARAVLEYCASRRTLGAKTMFATHYHELTALEGEIEGVKNFNIAAKKRGDSIIFLRKIVPGGADDSYGIEVAKLAGVPKPVVGRAREILSQLEGGEPKQNGAPGRALSSGAASGRSEPQMSMSDLRLQTIDPDTITPIEALNLLAELKKLTAM